MDPAKPGTKRKRPPTFQHFPANRAKALKRSWVEAAKIKSKWKAERRKSVLCNPHPQPSLDVEEEAVSEREGITVSPRQPNEQPLATTKANDPAPLGHKRRKVDNWGSAKPERVMRQDTRPASSDASRGKSTKQTSNTHTRRGQPNMKLRMEAMLEKIKRELA